MIRYNMADFYARSNEIQFSETNLARILEALPDTSTDGPWVAGGAFRRLLKGEDKVESDIDFFFKDDGQLEKWCEVMEKLGARAVNETEHNITYIVDLSIYKPGKEFVPGEGLVEGEVEETVRVTVQGIHFRFYENLEAVLDSFDFTICQYGFDGETLIVGDYTLWDSARMRLSLHKLTFGVSTMRRLLKYQKQGYYACSGCLTQILEGVAGNPSLIEADVKYVD